MSLIDDLISYWTFDEFSDGSGAVTRNDSHGTNHLTDNNTTPSGAGKIDNAADFELDNSEYLSHVDNADLGFGDDDFTFAYWVNHESTGGTTQRHISKWDSVSDQRNYLTGYKGPDDRFNFLVSDDGEDSTEVVDTNLGAPSTGIWYFIVVWHDKTANTINIQINNGAVDSTAHPTGINDDAEPFNVGRLSGGSQYMDGLIDEVGLWGRVLTADERTDLYNNGRGNAYSAWFGKGQAIFIS